MTSADSDAAGSSRPFALPTIRALRARVQELLDRLGRGEANAAGSS